MIATQPLQQPLRFQPFLRAMVWGGRRLGRFLGKNLPANVPIGESWEVSDHPAHASVVATGSHFGVPLRHLMEQHREELLGPAAAGTDRFPWLIKLLDVDDWLSVQVHPNAEHVAALLPGEGSKSEAWLVLDAEPGSVIYAGLRASVGPAELRAALTAGTVGDCLYRFTPRPGDFLYLPAGTVHAAGGGVLLAEIQETSDATFRLHDWNRVDSSGTPRPLHIEQALACIDWNQGPRDPQPAWLMDDLSCGGQTPLVHCPHFHVDHLRRASECTIGGAGVLQALIVTNGQGRLANGEFVLAGDAWILPAAMSSMRLHPEPALAGLLCTLP
jgi:mannose-6-phosphate isomerase